MSLLDRPVWASLTTHHAVLAEGGPLAKRFARGINVFASARDDSADALAALAALVAPGDWVVILQASEIVIPPELHVTKAATGVQMVATGRIQTDAVNDDIQVLGDADAAEMLALAKLTEPGPFEERTHTMGRFLGIRIDGRLAAMAGERMRMPGYTEVSGVCTHPDFRGRGLAARLSAAVAATIAARGDQPFLHAWKDNLPAISLYEKLGFRIRTEVSFAVLSRRG
ncbi:MAG TPA: GNAT family N-acetyltransferase [Gammaproteobacteria bacterium]|jgi:predicted GNAT family acetyltransferase|nr:GNAT family N-acetyltransferase [Gammaproteobacteria bacterium]